MKNLYTSICLLLILFTTKAQTFNNDWVSGSPKYAKITVSKTGIYEVSVGTIATALPEIIGAPKTSVSLAFRGKSVSFSILSTGSNLVSTDKIIFYGIENNGDLEKELYRPANSQPHSLSSLYSKESHYYLSLNNNKIVPKLIINETETQSGTATITQQLYKKIELYNSEFASNSTTGPIPIIQNSFFESGKGYTGAMLKNDSTYNFNINLNGILDPKISFNILFNGRDNVLRNVNAKVGNIDSTFVIANFDHRLMKMSPRLTLPLPSNNLNIKLRADANRYSVSYFRAEYIRSIQNNTSQDNIYLPINANTGLLKMSQGLSTLPIVYNITDIYNIKTAKLLSQSSTLDYLVAPANAAVENTYIYANTNLNADRVEIFNASNVTTQAIADYLIITHKTLKNSAEKYKLYRESAAGGLNKIEMVYIDELYDHFNFGVKSPLAIKNYLRYKLSQNTAKNLLLIGKAFSAHTGTNGLGDLVPSIGYPASDLLLSSGINTHVDVFGIGTGRIPALTNTEVEDYLDKIKRHESALDSINQKNVFHFNGGKTLSEIAHFGSIVDAWAVTAKASDYDVNLSSKRKTTTATKEEAYLGPIVNKGQSLLSYFGHSSYTYLDFNIGLATDTALGFNNSKYPVFYFNGCAFNNYFREINTMSKDWIFAKNKGSIGIIGQSYYGYESGLTKHATAFYETLFNSAVEPTIGEILKTVSQKVVSKSGYNIFDALNNNQTIFFGDPVTKIFGYNKVDLKVDETSVSNNIVGANRIIKFKYQNLGTLVKSSFKIKITEEGFPAAIETIVNVPAFKLTDSLVVSMPNINLLTKLRIELDYQNAVTESVEINNDYVFNATSSLLKIKDDAVISGNPGIMALVNVIANDSVSANVKATISNSTIDLDPLTTTIETTLAVANQGTWTYTAGNISFSPLLGFKKDPTPIYYTLIENGTNNKGYGKVTIDYMPIVLNQNIKFNSGTSKTINIYDNGTDGDEHDIRTIKIDGTASPGDSLLVANEGTWKIENSQIKFIPLPNFKRDPSFIYVSVKDFQGNESTKGKIRLDALPIARNDAAPFIFSQIIRINVGLNDIDGDLINPSTITFVGNPNSNSTANGGVWSIDNQTREIIFTPNIAANTVPPANGTLGLAPPMISYTVQDFQGNISLPASILLDDYPPILSNDNTSYSPGVKKTINLFSNDVQGDTPVEAFFIDSDQNTNGKSKTVPNEGKWEIVSAGNISFTPLASFAGSPSTVYYYSIDGQGTPSNNASINFAVILPVELEYFSAKPLESVNLLTWKAKSEKGFSHFEVFKSTDLIEFGKIGMLNGGNYYYSFEDKAYIRGIKYYKLKMVDSDGTFNFSKIISVINNNVSSINVFPNPVLDRRVNFESSQKILKIQLFTMKGDKVSQALNSDFNTKEIQINANISEGNYIMVFETEKGITTKKIEIIK